MNDTHTSICEEQPQVEQKDLIKVLLVDDDEGDSRLAQQILVKTSQQVKFTVESVDRLSTAIEHLSSDKYDIVLLDLGLPDSQGLETFTALHTQMPLIPIIVLSGMTDETLAIKAVQSGAQDYLIKGQSDGNTLARAICYAIERKKLAEKIEHAAQEWRTTFDSISDMVSIHDTDFKLVRVNKAFASAFNTEPKKIIGKTCYEVFHNTKEPHPECPHMWTLKTHKPSVLEFYEPHLKIHLGVSISPIFDDKGKLTGTVHIAKNITERRLAEENLRKANEKLKEYSQLKDEFVSIASHELRTPLSIIQGAIRLILDGISGGINPKQKEVLTMARENVERLGRIVNSLLTVSKIESGKLDLQKKLINICELIKSTTTEHEGIAQEKGINLDCEVLEQGIDICVDPDRIKQILINLISNSLKFTPEHGFVKVTCSQQNEEVVFSVQDSGVGIAKEDIPKLFDKFTQFGRKDGPGEKGTGLGLTIAKQLTELHGGNIQVESEVNKGTTFTVSLPLKAEDKKETVSSEADELIETTLSNN